MTKSFYFICFTLLCSLMVNAQNDTSTVRPLTFSEAFGVALINSPILEQANQNTLQKRQEVKAARGLYSPKVNLGAAYTFMSEDITMDFTPIKEPIAQLYNTLGHYGNFSGVPNPDPATQQYVPILPDDLSTQAVRGKLLEGYEEIEAANWNQMIQKKQFGVVDASFTWALYTGGRINIANKAAKIQVQESETELRQKTDELQCELVERYYGLVLAQQAEKVRNEVLQSMQSHMDDAEKLMQQGQISNTEYLHAKVYYSDADRQHKKAIRQIEVVNQALINTLDLEPGQSVAPVSNLFYVENIEPLAYFLDKAAVNSPLLEKINLKKELATQGYKAERAKFLPTVAATGMYDLYNKDLSPYVPEYMVGIGLQWEIFSGTARYNKMKASKLQIEQVESFYDKSTSDIHTAISKYYQEMQMALEQVKEVDASMEFANAYYDARQKSFREGLSTSTEVTDASLAVAKAKIERLEAMYNFDVALSKLLYYAGIAKEYQGYQERPGAKYGTY